MYIEALRLYQPSCGITKRSVVSINEPASYVNVPWLMSTFRRRELQGCAARVV